MLHAQKDVIVTQVGMIGNQYAESAILSVIPVSREEEDDGREPRYVEWRDQISPYEEFSTRLQMGVSILVSNARDLSYENEMMHTCTRGTSQNDIHS